MELSNNMRIMVRVMAFNATFNNMSVISWQSVLLVDEVKQRNKRENIYTHL
jgi:hypothetical protein